MSIKAVQSAYTALRSPETDTQVAALNGAGTMALSDIMPLADGNDNTKTPDYHLPFTGDQVTAALWKIINLDLNSVGGVIVLESSVAAPYALDSLVQIGNYTTNYISASKVPQELVGITPVNISVFTDQEGNLYQIIEGAGGVWYRFSKDRGQTWSDMYKKPSNAPVKAGDTVTTPPAPDPVEQLQTDVGTLKTDSTQHTQQIESVQQELRNTRGTTVFIGTTEAGTQILNGTFDYDTTLQPAASVLPETVKAAEAGKAVTPVPASAAVVS